MDNLRVFIDTEFTDFANRDIISLGLVTETGEEFYGENVQYEKAWASQFVKDNVLPLCDFSKYGMNRARLSGKAWEWLEELPAKQLTLIIDYGGDHELLYELFNRQPHPKIKSVQNIFVPMTMHVTNLQKDGAVSVDEAGKMILSARNAYKISFHNYFKDTNEIQHHALSDAKANLRGFNAMMQTVGLTY